MAYTPDDQKSVEEAILELATGKRVVRLTIAGKTYEYAQADLAALKELRTQIQSEINTASGKPGFYLTTTSKGL